MRSGTYVGSVVGLKGASAILRPDSGTGLILAQFDDLRFEYLSTGWHRFRAVDFGPREELDIEGTTISKLFPGTRIRFFTSGNESEIVAGIGRSARDIKKRNLA